MSGPLGEGRLERVIGWVLWLGIVASSVCLAAGLVIILALGDTLLARRLLVAGVILLLATPPARVMVSTLDYIRQRDWVFVTLTLVVLVELAMSLLAALRGTAS